MAVPQGGILQNDIEIEQQPSRTYRLDLANYRIVGMTDRFDAVKQAVFKILQTERFTYLIYSASYGFEGGGMVGYDRSFVQSEMKRRIREALLQDDRIISVENFQMTFEKDSALVRFTVISLYGNFEQEVMQGV